VLAACFLAAAAGAQTPPVLPGLQDLLRTAPPTVEARAAVLRGLDKITARISEIVVPVGQTVRFGTLAIAARACRQRPPEEPPESAAFLEIAETRPGEDEVHPLFSGWMFASSPALSALEHPVYDVWVIDCSNSTGEGSRPPK